MLRDVDGGGGNRTPVRNPCRFDVYVCVHSWFSDAAEKEWRPYASMLGVFFSSPQAVERLLRGLVTWDTPNRQP